MSTLHLGDIDMAYELIGAGEPVVLVHGLGSSGRDWEAQLAALTPRYRVLTYDVRGHGKTSKPRGPYTIPSSRMISPRSWTPSTTSPRTSSASLWAA